MEYYTPSNRNDSKYREDYGQNNTKAEDAAGNYSGDTAVSGDRDCYEQHLLEY